MEILVLYHSMCNSATLLAESRCMFRLIVLSRKIFLKEMYGLPFIFKIDHTISVIATAIDVHHHPAWLSTYRYITNHTGLLSSPRDPDLILD